MSDHVQYVVDVEGRLISASVSRDSESEDSSFVNVGTTTTTLRGNISVPLDTSTPDTNRPYSLSGETFLPVDGIK